MDQSSATLISESHSLTTKITNPNRVFLGWDLPLLHSARDYLEQRYRVEGQWDMDQVLLVLPSSLAGRRLGERPLLPTRSRA